MIFEIIALARPIEIPRLMLVAWRVKSWVEPLLYRVIFIASDTTFCGMQSFPVIPVHTILAAIESKPQSFFNCAVRDIFFEYDPGWLAVSAVNTILAACPHVTNLCAAQNGLPTDSKVFFGLQCLQRLIIDAEMLDRRTGISLSNSLYGNITHLELLDDWDEEPGNPEFGSRLADDIALIPRLTHFAFNVLVGSTTFYGRLRAQTRLQCIVFLHRLRLDDEHVPVLADDPRFVCVFQTNWRLDWLRGALGGPDYWVLAEEHIAAKRAGHIDASQYSISDEI
ncbi:hypothetical protein B0H19DRAFT_1181790 [Mycena capillaripes]|nr:hypothetical protein B0H19DRAFT_1181790 [Mycena capillaripes]